MKDNSTLKNIYSKVNFNFWAHLLVTSLAWFGPFLFSWYLMVIAYILVQLQFSYFGRCLMNGGHALDDSNDSTFYAYIFESLGFKPDHKVVRLWVRKRVNWILLVFTVIWQVVLGFEPLLFFK